MCVHKSIYDVVLFLDRKCSILRNVGLLSYTCACTHFIVNFGQPVFSTPDSYWGSP